ncbi:MAG: hypothetical protein WDO56_01645 [Gammaproteobacteria bacterium]
MTVSGAAEAGAGDPHTFRKSFGIGSSGASLVRPDGYVAWRSLEMPANPAAALIDCLGTSSVRDTREAG